MRSEFLHQELGLLMDRVEERPHDDAHARLDRHHEFLERATDVHRALRPAIERTDHVINVEARVAARRTAPPEAIRNVDFVHSRPSRRSRMVRQEILARWGCA